MSFAQEEEKNDLMVNLMTDEKIQNSPELSFSSNAVDSSDIPKQIAAHLGSKVIVENHSGTSIAGNPFSAGVMNNKAPKLNDLEAELSESSSNQSLPVISIKDTESNLPACKLLRVAFSFALCRQFASL